jgi:hypothetical protein
MLLKKPVAWLTAIGRGRRPLGVCLVLAGLVSASGCASFLSEPVWQAKEANRSWAVVTGARSTELVPGVVLELPDAPYRLWFSDEEGQFFRPSLPLTFKNSDGFAMAREGGIYIKRSEPGRGLVWFAPLVGRPTLLSAPHWQPAVRQYTLGP